MFQSIQKNVLRLQVILQFMVTVIMPICLAGCRTEKAGKMRVKQKGEKGRRLAGN